MNHPDWKYGRWLATAVVSLLWLFALVAGYFWAHKPFDLAIVLGLGRTLLALAVWLATVAIATAIGRRVAGDALAEAETAVRLALAAGIGLGLFSLGVWLWGMVGGLAGWLAWLLLLALLTLLRRDLRQLWREIRTVQRPQPNGRFEQFLLVFVVGTLLLSLVLALTPDISWDSYVYHLTIPKLYMANGRIGHPTDILYLGFPQLGEMQFLWGMLLAGDRVAPLFHFGYGLLAVVLTAGLAQRLFGRRAAWLATAVLLSVNSIPDLMRVAYVDITLLFYMTAAVYLFDLWQHNRSQERLLGLLGLGLGFCGGVKYTAVAVPLTIGLLLLVVSRRDGWRLTLRRLALLTAVTTLATLPWLLENWLTTGNPVYPFVLDNALYWDSFRAAFYNRAGTGLLATTPWRLLLAPLEATILGATGSASYGATIGPFILGALFLLPLVWWSLTSREKTAVYQLLFFLGVQVVIWLWGLARSHLLFQSRLLLPVFGITAVLVGLVLARVQLLKRPQLALDWLVRVVLTLTLALLLFSMTMGVIRLNPLPVIVGIEDEAAFRGRLLGTYDAVITAVNALPADSHVTFLWEPRTYPCTVICDGDDLLDHWLHLTQYEQRDAAAIAAQWRSAGVTHVLLHQAGLDFLLTEGIDPITPADLATLENLQQNHLTRIKDWQNTYTLYELTP